MSEEDVIYEVEVTLNELAQMAKKTHGEDRELAQIQVCKMRDMLDHIDALYGELD